MMSIKLLIENTVPLSCIESWEYNLAVAQERPLACGNPDISIMTGEKYLEELNPLIIDRELIFNRDN
jgi:hypothetical protein